jgi:sulfite reductase alpha subunit-like flavoprotein
MMSLQSRDKDRLYLNHKFMILDFFRLLKMSSPEELSLEKLTISDQPPSVSKRQILILYGSQTGCAQDAAERMSRQARRRHFAVRLYSMDAYDRVNFYYLR